VLVEYLLTKGLVEALDAGVPVGLAGLNVLDGEAVCLEPLSEHLTQEVRAVVRLQIEVEI